MKRRRAVIKSFQCGGTIVGRKPKGGVMDGDDGGEEGRITAVTSLIMMEHCLAKSLVIKRVTSHHDGQGHPSSAWKLALLRTRHLNDVCILTQNLTFIIQIQEWLSSLTISSMTTTFNLYTLANKSTSTMLKEKNCHQDVAYMTTRSAAFRTSSPTRPER